MEVQTKVYSHLVSETINKMIELAKEGKFTAIQEINGVKVFVNGDSDPELIFRDQQRAQSGYIPSEVGPYPKAELTAEDIANDDRIKAENQLKWAASKARYEEEKRVRRKKVQDILANAPAIRLTNEDFWRKAENINSRNSYGKEVIEYSRRWARLMQSEMDKGNKLEDVADTTSQEADLEGITGFMYACAVSLLAECWQYGDLLRRWHNLHIQIGNEGEEANEKGGVLNPAFLSIG